MAKQEPTLAADSVQQTLCIPLWGRKIAAEHYPQLFPDLDAGRIVEELGVDYSGSAAYRIQYGWMNCLIRQYNLAWEIRHYLETHPRAAVVELGAGMSCLRRQMHNETNPWYCLDMENVIALRDAHIPKGTLEQNVVCDLNDFSWFDKIGFRHEDGVVFVAGGLFYYFSYQQVQALLTAMAERFPGGLLAFDAVNVLGFQGVKAEVRMAGSKAESYFYLKHPKQELEGWSPRIVRVSERDYITGYLRGGYRPGLLMRLLSGVNRGMHMSFMLHVEFEDR